MKKKNIVAQILAYTFAVMFFVILYHAAQANPLLWNWYGWIFGAIGAANFVYLIVRVFAYLVVPEQTKETVRKKPQ